MHEREDKEMDALADKIDIKESLAESIKEVLEMRKGNQPKKPWRESISEIRRELADEK